MEGITYFKSLRENPNKQNTLELSLLKYKFVKILIKLIRGGLTPSSQALGSLIRPPGANVIKLFCLLFADFRNKLECLLFKSSLSFAGKARTYPSEAHFRCSTLGQAPGLTHKH